MHHASDVRQPSSANGSSISRRFSLSAPFQTLQRPLVVPVSTYASLESPLSPHDQPESPGTASSALRRRRSSALMTRPDLVENKSSELAGSHRWSQSTSSSQRSSSHQRKSSFSKRLSGSFNPLNALTNAPHLAASNGPLNRRTKPPALSNIETSGLSSLQAKAYALVTGTPSPATQSEIAFSPSINSFRSPVEEDFNTTLRSATDNTFADWQGTRDPDQHESGLLSNGAHRNGDNRLVSAFKVPESKFSPRVATFGRQVERQPGHRLTQHESHLERANDSSVIPENRGSSGKSSTKHKIPSQKTLLSRALAKANDAVVLDGMQDSPAAIRAYSDACQLLRQVMIRSAGDDDRRKLDAVRNTYKTRILELKTLSAHEDLGADLRTDIEYVSQDYLPPGFWQGRSNADDTQHDSEQSYSTLKGCGAIPSQQPAKASKSSYPLQSRHQNSKDQNYHSRFTGHGLVVDTSPHLQTPIYETFTSRSADTPWQVPDSMKTDEDDERTSWLKTINESSSSSASSIHSRVSPHAPLQRLQRMSSSAIEAEFDAALHAARDRPYHDDLNANDVSHQFTTGASLAQEYDLDSFHRHAIDLGLEEGQHMQREELIRAATAKERLRLRGIGLENTSESRDALEDELNHERHMLEEMTKEYLTNDAYLDRQSKTALPRQSDSSDFSGRTWGSFGSNPTSAGTSLSTVAELPLLASAKSDLKEQSHPPPLHPPPTNALPLPPASKSLPKQELPMAGLRTAQTSSVRSRRLSGSASKQLKIETNPAMNLSYSQYAGVDTLDPQDLGMNEANEDNARGASSLVNHRTEGASFQNNTDSRARSSYSDMTKVDSADRETLASTNPDSPGYMQRKASFRIRKALSTSSLRNDNRELIFQDNLDISPNTSISSTSSGSKHRRIISSVVPSMPKPPRTDAMVRDSLRGVSFVFNTAIHQQNHAEAGSFPRPLEPCPNSSSLRPFWFLRVIYQTIASPSGAYLTSRLFVPRDIWSIKNTKLKNVDEKTAACDSITSALQRLAKADMLDAETLFEEMQALESVFEQSQAILTKKLGSDVGIQSSLALLKGFVTGDDEISQADTALGSNANNKSYLRSFQRKLRSKGPPNSSINASGAVSSAPKHDHRESFGLKSLPMTHEAPDPTEPRHMPIVQGIGPYHGYMEAIARLCIAAQTLDQIARQIEDPGLKTSSPTLVGLDLCLRRAAEFFAFYICRFIHTDIALLLDKFIKRSSEWVMS